MKEKPHIVPSGIAILFLLGAFADFPYGYYTLLRFVVCGVATYVAYFSYQNRVEWGTWIFGAMAILFNPIIKIHLDRDLWQFIDLVAVVLFITVICKVKRVREEN